MAHAFELVDNIVRKYVPKWKRVAKKDSKLHKLISYFPPIIFMREAYLNNFSTTVGFTAAMSAASTWQTAFHEGMHAMQAKKYTRPLFSFLYLFPHILTVPVALALALFLSPWYWLLVLVTLLPMPSPFRALWELEAFKLTVMMQEWQNPSNTVGLIRFIVECFCGGSYYFMWPFSKSVEAKLVAAARRAQEWHLLEDKTPYEVEIYNFMKSGGYLGARARRRESAFLLSLAEPKVV